AGSTTASRSRSAFSACLSLNNRTALGSCRGRVPSIDAPSARLSLGLVASPQSQPPFHRATATIPVLRHASQARDAASPLLAPGDARCYDRSALCFHHRSG